MIKGRSLAAIIAASVSLAVLPSYAAGQQARPPANFGLMVGPVKSGTGGAVVLGVAPSQTAAQMGIQEGDLIIAVDQESVGNIVQYFNATRRFRAGEQVTMTVVRGGKTLRLTGITGARVSAVAEQAAVQQIIKDLSELLERQYVLREQGANYASLLRTRLADGAYYDLPDETAFAEKITADLRESFEDRHLTVVPSRNGIVATNLPRSGVRPEPIEKLARLTPQVAYMRFGRAPEDEAIQQEVVDFMKANSAAKHFIIDLRTARIGGRPSLPRRILSYFFDKPTMVVWQDFRSDVYDRFIAHGDTVTFPEDKRIDGPSGFVRFGQTVTPADDETRLRKANVIVLTSAVTGSAWELLAMSFATAGRATIIGETTAGRGNPSRWIPIGDSFRVLVPHGRLIDPRTNQALERNGVQPNVEVAAADALIEALTRLGTNRVKAVELSKSVGALTENMAPNDVPTAPTPKNAT